MNSKMLLNTELTTFCRSHPGYVHQQERLHALPDVQGLVAGQPHPNASSRRNSASRIIPDSKLSPTLPTAKRPEPFRLGSNVRM